jgi:uncharacterized protein YbaP (TraB family)
MRRYIGAALILFFLLFSGTVSAQLLWEISGNGLKKKSYIFGTHRYVPVSYLNEVHDLFKCYNDCKTIVSEVIVNEVESIEKMTHSALMPESVRNFLTEDEFALVDSVLQKEMELPLSRVAMMRPAMVKNMYEMTLTERLFPDMKNDSGMDSFFQRMARKQRIPVVGLTEIDDQIELLFFLQPIDRQAKLLVGSVKRSANIEDIISKQRTLYEAGNVNGLYAEFIADTTVYNLSEAERYLFYGDRNNVWVEKIETLIKDNPCFITVDVLHLPGTDGMIELLRKKGYKVRPIR